MFEREEVLAKIAHALKFILYKSKFASNYKFMQLIQKSFLSWYMFC